jgi:hypothetical protein
MANTYEEASQSYLQGKLNRNKALKLNFKGLISALDKTNAGTIMGLKLG